MDDKRAAALRLLYRRLWAAVAIGDAAAGCIIGAAIRAWYAPEAVQ